ncbi:MAG: GNAT family acetyltransferase [Lachnospiraceae bacterium]|nr:GNAT family acetyltransferase [Lachnospiraceae bacterium]
MSEYTTVNILDMIDVIGEDNMKCVLSDFSCPKNEEIEHFVKKNAIDFAKRKMSVTHLVMNDKGNLAAIFTLTHKAVEISDDGLSSISRKKIKRYAQIDEKNHSYMVSAFLIAQFGKNYGVEIKETLDGNRLMENAMKVLEKVQRDVGGGIVYLECEDKPKLLSFYENDQNRFRVFDDRYSDVDSTKYIQLLRFF